MVIRDPSKLKLNRDAGNGYYNDSGPLANLQEIGPSRMPL